MSSLQNLHDESGHAARLRDVTTLRSTHRSTLVAFPVLECLVPDVNDIEMSRGRWTRKMHRANAILRAVGAGGRNLRSILLRHYREVFRRDPDMIQLLPVHSRHPRRIPPDAASPMPEFQDALEKIPILTSVADLYGMHDTCISRGETRSPDEREYKRVRLWERTLHSADDILEEIPEAIYLLPDPHNAMISKRDWERALYLGRACMRILAAADRREGHNFALGECRDVLRRFPHLRDLLPDPADDQISDTEWMRMYTTAMRILLKP